MKKRRKKQKKESHADKSKTATSDSDTDVGGRKKKGWTLNIASPPPPELCESDDEVNKITRNLGFFLLLGICVFCNFDLFF